MNTRNVHILSFTIILVFLLTGFISTKILARNYVSQDILFSDNFDDGNADGWTVNGQGSWSVDNGQYTIDMGSGYSILGITTAGSDEWTDYTYEATIQGESGVDKHILFRVADTNNFYQFNLRSNPFNDATLGKRVDNSYIGLDTVSYPNTNGVTYSIKIIVQGSHFQCYINDNLIIDFTENSLSFSKGKIGLFGWTGATGSDKVRYDNIRVTSIPPSAALSGRITSPNDNDTIGPATIFISAEASSNIGSNISSVEFMAYYDSRWHTAGVDTSSPFQVVWEMPNELRSQKIQFGIHINDDKSNRVEFAGGVRTINYIESLNNIDVLENWIPTRAYLNQRSISPFGDCRCSATSMSMLLAMNSIIPNDYKVMHDKVIEMYELVAVGSEGCRGGDWGKMRNELERQGTITAKSLSVQEKSYTIDTAWEAIKSEIDLGRPVIVRTGVTSKGHIMVAVGYRQAKSGNEIIAYDPFGKWKGIVDSWDANTSDSDSHKGQWVYYNFGAIFRGILITAQRTGITATPALRAITPSTPPDITSPEQENIVSFTGVKDYISTIFLPTVSK